MPGTYLFGYERHGCNLINTFLVLFIHNISDYLIIDQNNKQRWISMFKPQIFSVYDNMLNVFSVALQQNKHLSNIYRKQPHSSSSSSLFSGSQIKDAEMGRSRFAFIFNLLLPLMKFLINRAARDAGFSLFDI